MTEAQVSELAGFISARTGGAIMEDWARLVITDIVSGPEAVFELRREGQRVGVALVIDTCQSEGNAAELSVFAGATAAADPDGSILRELLDWGEAFVARGSRDHIDVPAWRGITLPPATMSARGYRIGYAMHEMHRPERAAPTEVAAPPPGWTWAEPAEPLLRDYYELWAAAFREVPGAFLTEFESFAKRAREGQPPAQLLLDDRGQLQGFVRVALDAEGGGEIGSLGRHPRQRGRGLGPVLLGRGLELLRERGARRIRLEVAAVNRVAIELYRSFGFEVDAEMQVWRRPARGRPV